MHYRQLGRTGFDVSTISFGAWAIGGSWGDVDDEESMRTLHAAIDAGVNFIDTADVYGDGRSERLVARLRRERPGEAIYVATKAGRRLPAQTPGGYSRENLHAWVDRSRRNLEMDAIDLLQLHCPPTPVFGDTGVYAVLDEMVAAGTIRHYGVSVERVDEALEAIRHPGVKTVQIIFNMFRLKPAERFFPAAKAAHVGILARVPLASGLLTGKLSAASSFAADDHRNFNRNGEEFDKGETFSGVPYDVGLAAVEELKRVLAGSEDPAYYTGSQEVAGSAGSQEVVGRVFRPGEHQGTLAQFALRWILTFDAVTCAIPGARTPDQARANAAAADLPPLDRKTIEAVRDVYDRFIRDHVQPLW
jgi:aryl-alcohol dehydrogenase-like predicted oxidoreductase